MPRTRPGCSGLPRPTLRMSLSLSGVNLPSCYMPATAKVLFIASSSIGSSKNTPVLAFLWFPSTDPIRGPFTDLLGQHWQPYCLLRSLFLPPFRNLVLVPRWWWYLFLFASWELASLRAKKLGSFLCSRKIANYPLVILYLDVGSIPVFAYLTFISDLQFRKLTAHCFIVYVFTKSSGTFLGNLNLVLILS